jgi:uncharacterized protein
MELTSREALRTIYRPASGGAVDKVIHRLDEHCVNFLAKSPFMVLSTADENGVVDGSPKGGLPGFAQALDGEHVAWADSSGNNRLDSFENVVANPHVALLFMIPGLDETLRVNGTASLSTDPTLCERFSFASAAARVVVVVEVAEAYLHCAKAFRRANLWDPDSWPTADELPSGIEILRDHAKIEGGLEVLEDMYQKDAAATLWKPGGSAKQTSEADGK